MLKKRPRRSRKLSWIRWRIFPEKEARALMAQSHIEQLQRQGLHPPRQP